MADRLADASMEWDTTLSTGVSSIDTQHKALFDCLNLLEGAALERNMLRTFHVMEQLSGYVHNHFAEEEFLMRTHGYPGLPDHVKEHRSFTNKLFQLRKTYLDRDISAELIVLLREWLAQHITQTDMQYVPYLTADRRLDSPILLAGTAAKRMDTDILSSPAR